MFYQYRRSSAYHHELSLTVIKKMYIRMRLYKKETLVVGLLYKGESGDLLDSLLQVDIIQLYSRCPMECNKGKRRQPYVPE